MATPAFTDDRPVALTVAGSDCSGGAGLQADLKTFTAHRVYGLTAITCAVSEIPGQVSKIEELSPSLLRDQVTLLCRSFPVRAIKTGMLYSKSHIVELVAALEEVHYNAGLVVDPVMVASSGDPLIREDAVAAYQSLLFPRAGLVTPNLEEARVLLGGREIRSVPELTSAAMELSAQFNTAFLVKGGHLDGDEATDVLCLRGGETHSFTAPAISGVITHGTGCTYSAAIAAQLARGLPLEEAVRKSKAFITRAIRTAFRWDSPKGEIHALNTE